MALCGWRQAAQGWAQREAGRGHFSNARHQGWRLCLSGSRPPSQSPLSPHLPGGPCRRCEMAPRLRMYRPHELCVHACCWCCKAVSMLRACVLLCAHIQLALLAVRQLPVRMRAPGLACMLCVSCGHACNWRRTLCAHVLWCCIRFALLQRPLQQHCAPLAARAACGWWSHTLSVNPTCSMPICQYAPAEVCCCAAGGAAECCTQGGCGGGAAWPERGAVHQLPGYGGLRRPAGSDTTDPCFSQLACMPHCTRDER
jgi:hypothetical protein